MYRFFVLLCFTPAAWGLHMGSKELKPTLHEQRFHCWWVKCTENSCAAQCVDTDNKLGGTGGHNEVYDLRVARADISNVCIQTAGDINSGGAATHACLVVASVQRCGLCHSHCGPEVGCLATQYSILIQVMASPCVRAVLVQFCNLEALWWQGWQFENVNGPVLSLNKSLHWYTFQKHAWEWNDLQRVKTLCK